jgi:hypothetical protein
MQGVNRELATNATHVLLLIAMFSFGIVAFILYFRITAKLDSIGEKTPSLFERKRVFAVLKKYRQVADEHFLPKWLPLAFWAALGLSLVSGLFYVYWR